jgi:hypothetical protein
MDLGLVAEGVALAEIARYFYLTVEVHLIASIIAGIGAVVGGRAARVLGPLALIAVVANHIALARAGLWRPVVLDDRMYVFTVMMIAYVAFIAGVTIQAFLSRPPAPSPTP